MKLNPVPPDFQLKDPEIALILCCARVKLTPEMEMRLRHILETGVWWDKLMGILSYKQHWSIRSFVFYHINCIFPGILPKAIELPLRQQFDRAKTRNQCFTDELLKIIALFDQNNISAVPLKGVVLLNLLYNDLPIRAFSDIDILIKKEDLSKAKYLLINSEYKPGFDLTSDREEAFYFRFDHECDFIKHTGDKCLEFEFDTEGALKGNIYLDLHWSIRSRRFPRQIDIEFWNRLSYIKIRNQRVLTLSPSDLLFFLCIHGTKEAWYKLQLICDVAEFIRTNPQFDWDKAIKDACRLRIQKIVYLGLLLAHMVIGVDLPKDVVTEIKSEKKIKSLAIQIFHRLFHKNMSRIPVKYALFLEAQLLETKFDKLHHYGGHLFLPGKGDWAFLKLPLPLSYLHYLIRPLRLFAKHYIRI